MSVRPPNHAGPVRGHYQKLVRFKRYKPNSEQARKGMVGRWQEWTGHGWSNCAAPDRWESAKSDPPVAAPPATRPFLTFTFTWQGETVRPPLLLVGEHEALSAFMADPMRRTEPWYALLLPGQLRFITRPEQLRGMEGAPCLIVGTPPPALAEAVSANRLQVLGYE